MHFYIPKPLADDYDYIQIVKSNDLHWFINYRRQYYVHGIEEPWQTILTEVVSLGRPGDFPSFSALDLVFSERALNYLEDLISGSIEALPLKTMKNSVFFYIKVLNKLDCLDYEHSVWERNPSGLIRVESYVFQEKLVRDRHIFWLPHVNHFIVSELFKELVERCSLEGLAFQQIA